jgi:hypothetical protein
MTVTSNDIANQAIQYIGDNQPPITGVAPTFDSSTAGVACSKFYTAVVQTIGRKFAWEFTRATLSLALTGNVAPQGYLFEYAYPASAIEIWQLLPATVVDTNNPLPQTWSIGNSVVGGTQSKVIWTNVAGALAVCNNMPSENTWDSLFRESVVRLLASVMAMALAGKPDAAQAYLDSAGQFEQVAEARGN